MRAPRAKKPTSVDEVTRVLRIYDLIDGELQHRVVTINGVASVDARLQAAVDIRSALLTVAERIAARTDDGDPA